MLGETAALEAAGVSLKVVYTNRSGEAHADLALYAGDAPESLYDSESLVELNVDLVPGVERTLERQLATDPRLLQLVGDGRLYLGFRFDWTPAGHDTISGSYRITQLEFQVTSRLGGLLGSMQPVPSKIPAH